MVHREVGTTHTFRTYLPEAEHVELVGSFTDWRGSPIRMVKEPSGWWTVRLDLPQGDHDFSYLVNGATFVPDYAACGVRRNPFGGWVSQLQVVIPSTQPRAAAA